MRTFHLVTLLVLTAAALAACDRDPNVDPGPEYPPRGEIVSGDLQTDTVGDLLPQPVAVRVTDQEGEPIAGQTVSFVVTAGGGSLFAATAQTSADGVASNQWTLGTVAGDTQRVEARMIDPGSGQPVLLATFRAVGVPDAPAAITPLPPVSRTGGAGQTLADSLRARVTDPFGNPVPGVPVVWSATGGGTVSPAGATTDALGIARAAWTLGTTVGAQQTAAASLSPAVRAEFTAVASVPMGAVLVKVAGDGQTGTVGDPLASALTVELRTADGQRISGATVHWTPAAGSGGASPGSGPTDGNGQASTVWMLGTTPGTQQITASVDGATPAVFTTTAEAGAPATLTKIAGDAQTAPPNAPLPQALTVAVRDRFGNPLPGVTVTWAVTGGGGSILPTQSQTNEIGQTSVQWTLGPTVGQQAATAAVGGTTVTFTATGQVGPVAAIEVTPASVNFASLTETRQLQARAVDAYGNTVPGVPLTWSTTSGAVATVNASGLVTSVGNGTAQIRASGGGAAGTSDITVQQVPAIVGITPGVSSLIEFDTTRLRASVRDARNQPIPGATVTWSTTQPSAAIIDSQGLVTARGAGTPTLTATTSNGISAGRTITTHAAHRADTIAVGQDHTCTLDSSGTARCWGVNRHGELGNSAGDWRTFPVAVAGRTFVAVTAGNQFTCGIAPGGDAYCWGYNAHGQLGFPDPDVPVDHPVPTLVQGGHTWAQLDAGDTHACGITTAGAAYCWGSNAWGELGSLAGDSDQCVAFVPRCAATPQPVPGGPYRQISAGSMFTCAVTLAGAGYCWGYNGRGQIGDGTAGHFGRPSPTAVAGGHSFALVTTGASHACGLTTAGEIYCWGRNQTGQAGIGAPSESEPMPREVAPLATPEGTAVYAFVQAGLEHTCAVTTAGRAACWGDNLFAQLGDGTTTDRLQPTPVDTPRRFTTLGGGYTHSCGVDMLDVVLCWGSSYGGKLGTGSSTGAYIRPGPVRAP